MIYILCKDILETFNIIFLQKSSIHQLKKKLYLRNDVCDRYIAHTKA